MSASPVEPTPVSVVTGAARGLGLAVARALAARGDRVWVVFRSEPPERAELRRDFGDRLWRADATRADQVHSLAQAVHERDGRVDHLVHAVGEYHRAPLAETGEQELRRMLASNVESAMLLAGAFRQELRASAGAAVFFGCAGIVGPRAWKSCAAYAAAKTALLVLARSLAVEEAAFGVRVNMLSPGHVPHPHAASDTNDPRLWRRIPMGRPGTLEEVAQAALWLCSPQARYVTGANLELGGGWML